MSVQPQTSPTAAPAAAEDAPILLHWGLRLLAYPLFFASGAAGLIYEVVWTRMLLGVFGAGLYAICAVLAAFMAGLALGSWILGRTSDRLTRPLRLYALIELAIGLCGLALPLVLGRAGLADGFAYRTWGQNFALLTAFRFVLSFAMMIVPTTLMGATLPVLSRFMVREQSHLGMHVGGLYAVNTFGAVAGTFAAGFVLIGQFGVIQSECAAAAFNLVIAGLAFLISTRLEPRPASRPAPAPAPAAVKIVSRASAGPRAAAPVADLPAEQRWANRWIFFTAFMTGGVALAAQVLWSRSLVFSFDYLKNTTYAFSAMLTVFLAGLAIGSAIIGLVIDRQREPMRLYGILLALVGMSILYSITMLYYGADLLLIGDPFNPTTGRMNWLMAVANVMMQSVGVLGVPTLIMGMAFPVAARVVVQVRRVGRDVGRLYALNTLGAILGSVLAGFVIVPALGLTRGLLTLGVVDMVLGLVTIWLSRRGVLHLKIFVPLSAAMAAAVIWGLPHDRGLQRIGLWETERFYKEGPLATVSVVENRATGDRLIYVDGVGVAGTDPVMQTDQKSLAHVPMMLLTKPTAALTVGFGSGGCSYSLQLHDPLQRIDCVEICPTVLDAAPWLTAANHGLRGEFDPGRPGALIYPRPRDPRYRIIFDDARSYLRYTEEAYDFIATDCTDLRYKSNANLYDLEYFQACRDRLTPEGIVVVWMPLAGLSKDMFKCALRTFHRVFPKMGVFFMDNEPTHYILLIGWQHEIQLDYAMFARQLEDADVREDLAELYLDDPVKLLSCFITGGEALDRYLAGDVLNTQNHPVIEFESPKYGYEDKPLIDNLDDLMSARVSPRAFLRKDTIPPAELERLKRYETALPWIIKGHDAFRKLQLEDAARDYMKANEIAPEDLSVSRNLLTFPMLQKRIQHEPTNFYPYLSLGRLLMLQETPEKLEQAYDLLGRAEVLLQARLDQIERGGGKVGGEEGALTNPQYLRDSLADARAWRQQIRRFLRPDAP
ncbi:MAG: fused MFS/spermidine synthase [bacterium]|nr:fused MFS/spermidine synthase [bacterium]